jgi:hypothetical protein
VKGSLFRFSSPVLDILQTGKETDSCFGGSHNKQVATYVARELTHLSCTADRLLSVFHLLFQLLLPRVLADGVKGEVHPRTGHEGLEGEWGYTSNLYLTSALDGVGCKRHALVALLPGWRSCTHCAGDWVGPRASVDECGKSRPHWDSIFAPSSRQRVAIPAAVFRPTASGVKRVKLCMRRVVVGREAWLRQHLATLLLGRSSLAQFVTILAYA